MQRGEEPGVEEAINEIAALLSAAYRRRARSRLVRTTAELLPSTEGLDSSSPKSVHELTLTGQRKESTQP